MLIRGETGSGKEMVARALHGLSAPEEQRGPFVVFDCSSVSPHQLESELFGHNKGAFTGADRDSVGVVEAANGGTLFLDAALQCDPWRGNVRELRRSRAVPVGNACAPPSGWGRPQRRLPRGDARR